MPTLTVRKDIFFHYTDSGPVEHNEYSTLLFVHGLSFHSGIFQRLLPAARSHALRVICLDRREYQGSSPYTDEELRLLNYGSDEDRAGFLQEQGVLIALLVDGIIQTLSLPKAGGLAVIGWSMGNIFTLALRACVSGLPADVRERLKAHVRSFILWDPPIQCFGFPLDPPQPSQMSQEEFVATFPTRITTHFKHVDLDSKDPSKLDQIGDPSRKPTSETMTPEELSSTLNFAPSKYEFPLLSPIFSPSLSNQMTNALVDSQVGEDWGGGGTGRVPVWHICGENNPAVIQTAPWLLEGKVNLTSLDVHFKPIKDANHFLMWEGPDRCLVIMKECMLA